MTAEHGITPIRLGACEQDGSIWAEPGIGSMAAAQWLLAGVGLTERGIASNRVASGSPIR